MEPKDKTSQTIIDILTQGKYRLKNEDDLQKQIATILQKAGITHEREKELSKGNRIDFYIPEGIGIEVKINGAGTKLLYQINRYAKEDKILSLIVLTIRPITLPKTLQGKPIFNLPIWNKLDAF